MYICAPVMEYAGIHSYMVGTKTLYFLHTIAVARLRYVYSRSSLHDASVGRGYVSPPCGISLTSEPN